MENVIINLSSEEKQFIIDALNNYFHEAHEMLKQDNGDILKRQASEIKDKAKYLIDKLNNF